jgi:cation diffusion facilitator CzcD-associated flavoprotein CzcO
MDSQVPAFAVSGLPVAVIGAGPVGLAAAAHLIVQGESPVIFESGTGVGANILAWGTSGSFPPGATSSTRLPEICSKSQAGRSRISMPTRRGRRS